MKLPDHQTGGNPFPGALRGTDPGAFRRGSEWLTKEVGKFYAEFLRGVVQSGRSGLFYCQIVDTETECDGLMSYDRTVPKVDPARVAAAIRAARPELPMGTR